MNDDYRTIKIWNDDLYTFTIEFLNPEEEYTWW